MFSPPSKIICASQEKATSTNFSRCRIFPLLGLDTARRLSESAAFPMCLHQVKTDHCVLLEGPVTPASEKLFRKPLKNIVIALVTSELYLHKSSVMGANAKCKLIERR